MKQSSFRVAVAFAFFCTLAGSTWAQFPKIPKVLKKLPGQSKPDDAKSPQGPTPELTSVTPDTVPPGGSGELTLAGKNLAEGVRLRISCEDYMNAQLDSIKIESPERAVAHVTFPEEMRVGTCVVYLEFVRGAGGEILPSAQGTPEVVQAKSVSIRVSDSSTSLPVGLGEYALITDTDLKDIATMDAAQVSAKKMTEDMQSGKVNPMDPEFIKKMQEAAAQMSKMAQMPQSPAETSAKGQLILKTAAVSFVQEGKTVFDQPTSKIKEITEIHDPMGRYNKIIRLAFNDGKAYGLGAGSSGGMDLDKLKKKLGK